MLYFGTVKPATQIPPLNLSTLVRDSTGDRVLRNHPVYHTPNGFSQTCEYLHRTNDVTYSQVFGNGSYKVERVAIFIPTGTAVSGIIYPPLWSGPFSAAKHALNFYAAEASKSGASFTFALPTYDLKQIESAYPNGRTSVEVKRPGSQIQKVKARGQDIELDVLYAQIRSSSPTTEPKQIGIKMTTPTGAKLSVVIMQNGVVRFNDFQEEHLHGKLHPSLGDPWNHVLPLIDALKPYRI
jgi:hypothetical protein